MKNKSLDKCSLEELTEFKSVIEKDKNSPVSLNIENKKILKITFKPKPVITISKNNKAFLSMEYNLRSLSNEDRDKDIDFISRDKEFEKICHKLMDNDIYFSKVGSYNYSKLYKSDTSYIAEIEDYQLHIDFYEWLKKEGLKYIKAGFKIKYEKDKMIYDKDSKKLILKSNHNQDWFEFTPVLIDEFGDDESEEYVIDLANSTVKDKEGYYYILTQDDLDKFKNIIQGNNLTNCKIKIPAKNPLLLNEYLDEDDKNLYHNILKNSFSNKSFENIKPAVLSENFKGSLRNYQQAGFDWLMHLHENKLSGCLADDMGLGKTIQTLALLISLKAQNRLKTSLLVVPLSALPNWSSEINKFTPDLKYIKIQSSKDFGQDLQSSDLILCSYQTLRKNSASLKKFNFD